MDIEGFTSAEYIGAGSYSTVYRARQVAFDRQVALKVLSGDLRDRTSKRRFERECAAMGRVSQHPAIVTVFGSGFTPTGAPYIVMDYLSGGSLQGRIDRIGAEGAVSVPEVLRTGVRLAAAVETAHRQGVLHRDIKPENVLVSAYGQAQLTDFGIAVFSDAEHRTAAAYTPLHAPPEQAEGETTQASDIYSLGSTLYALLAGRAPFQSAGDPSVLALLVRTANDPVPPIGRGDVPAALTDLLLEMLAKAPDQRPESALDVGDRLRSVQAQMGLPVDEMLLSADESAATATTITAATGIGAATSAPLPAHHQPTVEDAPPSPWEPLPVSGNSTPLARPSVSPWEPMDPVGGPPAPNPSPATAGPQGADVTDTPAGSVPGSMTVAPRRLAPPETAASVPVPSAPPERGRPGLMVAAAVAAVLVLVVAVAAGIALLGRRDPDAQSVRTTTTSAAAPAPAVKRPTNLQVTATGAPDTVSITWSDPNGGRVPYAVISKADRPGAKGRAEGMADRNSMLVTGLDPSTTYCFIVVPPSAPQLKSESTCTTTPAGAGATTTP